jgi:hypothetical protein
VFTGLSIGTMHRPLPIQKPVPGTAAPRRASRNPIRIVAPAAGVLALIAIVWWFSSGGTAEMPIQAQARRVTPQQAAPVSVAKPAPAPDNSAALAALAAAQAQSNAMAIAIANQQRFNAVKLQAVFYRPNSPTAMINGRTVGVGERFDGMEVVRITQTSVVLAFGTEQREFTLNLK